MEATGITPTVCAYFSTLACYSYGNTISPFYGGIVLIAISLMGAILTFFMFKKLAGPKEAKKNLKADLIKACSVGIASVAIFLAGIVWSTYAVWSAQVMQINDLNDAIRKKPIEEINKSVVVVQMPDAEKIAKEAVHRSEMKTKISGFLSEGKGLEQEWNEAMLEHNLSQATPEYTRETIDWYNSVYDYLNKNDVGFAARFYLNKKDNQFGNWNHLSDEDGKLQVFLGELEK